MSIETQPVEFDPFSDDFFDDPTEMYRRLHDEAPVSFSKKYGFSALSRSPTSWPRTGTGRASRARTASSFLALEGSRGDRRFPAAHHDGSARARPLPRARQPRVTPRAVTSLEPMIREVIRGYLDPLNDATEFDAVADFAAPFPVEVISRMLGVPAGERQQIRHWLDREPRARTGPDRAEPRERAGRPRVRDVLASAHGREAHEPGRRHAVAPDAGHGRPGRR